MSQRQQHNRTSSHGRKALPPHARPTKPPPLRRGTSYNHPHSHLPSASAGHHHSKSLSGGSKNAAETAGQHVEEDENGMTSFLQFCATCEKQIVTPGAILYCSEGCRKQDISRSTSVASLQSLESVKSPSGVSSACSYFEHPLADIIPQRSPTVLRPLSMSLSDFSFPTVDLHPACERSNARDGGIRQYWPYSSQDTHRPRVTNDTTLPSLVHSPSSSWGTIASNASYRHLAPRHNPFSTDSHHTKSIDLVIPSQPPSPTTPLLRECSLKSSASTVTSFRVAEAADITYERRRQPSSSSPLQSPCSGRPADHSSTQLFRHDAVKAPPRLEY